MASEQLAHARIGEWKDSLIAPKLNVRIYDGRRQDGRSGDVPLILHFHGGGFVDGDLDSGAAVASVLAGAGSVVVSLDYPLAPAWPFPAAAEAGDRALAWLARERTRLAGPRAPLFVAGEEAGGNLAAAVAMMSRDRGGPTLSGQILISPMLDSLVATASQRGAPQDGIGSYCADGWRAYLANADDAMHPYAAPAQSLRQLGLPPALLITASDDPLRDETREHANHLQTAGVHARLHVLPGPTGWPMSLRRPLPETCAAAIRDAARTFLAAPAAIKPARKSR